LIEKYEKRLKSGNASDWVEEDFSQYGPMDSFANAPFQDSKTRAGQVIPIREMVNEEQYRQFASTPKGENSLKPKFNPSAS
jgi:hypothetical protein